MPSWWVPVPWQYGDPFLSFSEVSSQQCSSIYPNAFTCTYATWLLHLLEWWNNDFFYIKHWTNFKIYDLHNQFVNAPPTMRLSLQKWGLSKRTKPMVLVICRQQSWSCHCKLLNWNCNKGNHNDQQMFFYKWIDNGWLNPRLSPKKRAHSPFKPLALSASLISFRGLSLWLCLRLGFLRFEACLQAFRSCLTKCMGCGLIPRVA